MKHGVWCCLLVACGSSSSSPHGGVPDGGAAAIDAAVRDGAVIDAPPDAAPDAPPDAFVPPDAPRQVAIQDVQGSAVPVGAAVELHGVIVTAIDTFGEVTGRIWVEEASGGPFSGIPVFGASLAQVTALSVGDQIDVAGAVKSEFHLASDTTGRSVTELVAPSGGAITLTKVGVGVVPAPALLDVQAIAQLPPAEADAEREKWAGVLVRVTHVAATGPIVVNPLAPDVGQFPVTGALRVEQALAMFPSGIATGTCFDTITGVLDYLVNYNLLPRQTDEIVLAPCPAVEKRRPAN